MAAPPAALVAQSRATLATHARSFRWGAFFLPPDRRGAAAIVYAFCRMVDDLVDEAGDVDELLRVRDELTGARPARPLVEVFADVVSGSREAVPAALELIGGVRGDAGRVRIDDDAGLLRYCYRVAGTVGLLMCPVLGVTDRAALPHAIDLGIAMQITNICRDVAEDLTMDRVYLPASRLEAAGAPPGATTVRPSARLSCASSRISWISRNATTAAAWPAIASFRRAAASRSARRRASTARSA
jgi:phytoene synthase